MNDGLKIAIPKGRIGEDAIKLLQSIHLAESVSLKSRKLVFKDSSGFEYILVKSIDVIAYVENGVADIGFLGSDVLLEQEADLYELYDTEIGQCKFAIAGFNKSLIGSKDKRLSVATKYPNITKKYFQSIQQQCDIIPLNGSVELAPLVGLSHVIVDIVETGNTLKANGLMIIEEMFDISTKLIANRAKYRFKRDKINAIIHALEMGKTYD